MKKRSPGSPGAAPVPAIELRDVRLSLRGNLVLDDVSLTLDAGQFLGIIGPNGAGKTMLLHVLLGLIKPDHGRVRIFGRSPESARADIGYVTQHARFPLGFPIRVIDLVLMGRLGRDRLLRRHRRLDRERAMEALETVKAADLAQRQIGRLSGGQLQRVLVARALAVDARLLLLDEPTASLDPRIGHDFYDMLAGFCPRLTVVLVSHDVGVISSHVTSVACMNRKLFFHNSNEISHEMIERTYGPMELVVHSHTHHHGHVADGDAPATGGRGTDHTDRPESP